ncbi:MAG: acyl-ACP--UDP-N-acetylglucosamine O-acyltransferase [Bacteroidota bacterium]|nr:acyl-ACP--UDP-N-acetylglucosamine O-acyltransferase [Bacteroidota bacterium]
MIHKLANIHPDAQIGKNVTIEAFVTIDNNVVIGDGCRIDTNAVIRSGARLGKNVQIFSGAVISEIPQDLKFQGEETTTEIGDNTLIREYVTINRGTAAKKKTIIGKNCLFMAYSHIAHDCKIGNNVILVNATQVAGEVEIDDFAILGGSTLVHQFCKIGKHAMTQGGLKVSKDVPPFVKAARSPASYMGVNSIGLRRRGFSNPQIDHIRDIYRIIFTQGLNYKNAIQTVKDKIKDSEERTLVLEFFKNSSRGIIQGMRTNNRK